MSRYGGLTDEQLVGAYLAGGRKDDAMFREIFNRRRQDVWRVCYGYFGHRQDAEELTQEIFFTAYRKLHQFQGRASLRTWLHRMASNACKNELRRRSRRTQSKETRLDASPVLSDPETPEDRLAASRRDEHLARAMGRLSPQERHLLEKIELEGTSYAELARELGISLSAVRMRILRARLSLRSAYRDHHPGGSPP